VRNKHLHVMLVRCFTALIVTVYWNELQPSRRPPSRLGRGWNLVSWFSGESLKLLPLNVRF